MLSGSDGLRRISAQFKASSAKLSPAEIASIRLMIDETRKINNLLQNSRYMSRYRRQKSSKAQKLRANPVLDGVRKGVKGIFIDGVRCCRVCKRPIPHKTKDEFRFHMLAIKRRHMQQAAYRYWTRVGYDVMWHKSVAARQRRSIDRKLAIFQAECPISWSKMSRDAVIRVIVGYVNPKTGFMHGPTSFRRWVRKRFR